MKVLFICSGNSGDISTTVRNQAESLQKKGIEIFFYTIVGKGFRGYLKHIFRLRKFLKNKSFDIYHAHYSLSAFVAAFAKKGPLVVSLMGSDAYMSKLLRRISYFFYRYTWDVTIVKSKGMYNLLKFKKAEIIPNGVDLEKYISISKSEAKQHIGYISDKKLIIFVASPDRTEKNFGLARLSVEHLHRNDVELIPVFNVPNSIIPFYMNAADVLLLTSKWEGSVNVVKEAMACNLPIVSTDVGDVKENTSGVAGCYICESDPSSLAEGIDIALQLETRTNGREKIISLKLDSESVAEKIISVYEEITGKN